MKSFIAIILFSVSVSSFAGQNWMYCKTNGQRINLTDVDGYKCADALIAGETCFTGDRARTVGFLNSTLVKAFFDGKKGIYIQNATGNEAGSVTYTTVDETKNLKVEKMMKRCLNSFFLD